MRPRDRRRSRPFWRSRLARSLTILACLTLASPASGADRLGVRAGDSPFTVAGTLGGAGGDAYDDYTFRSEQPALLFVTAASYFYQSAGRGGESGCGEDEAEASCQTSAPGEEEEEHGRALLCLQVLDPVGDVLCWAERPAQPGWQRDPRLSCALPGLAGGTYTLRVSYADQGCDDTEYPPAPAPKHEGEPPITTPYLLEGALRAGRDAGPLF